MRLKLPLSEHGFKSGGSYNCNFTFDESVCLFDYIYFDFCL